MARSDQSASSSRLSCELRIIRAENVEELIAAKKLKGGCLFVRMHLSAGGNKNKNARVQLKTRDLVLSSSKSSSCFSWDESFRLECKGTVESVNSLKRGSVSLELRWRPTSGWVQSSSKLLGRVELPWEPAFCSPESEVKGWVPFDQQMCDSAAAGLLVAMTVKVQQEEAATSLEAEGGRRRRGGRYYEDESCGCPGSYCQENYELFALAAALEAF